MKITALQLRLAKALDIDVAGDNFYIAAAKLSEAIWPALDFHQMSQHPASKKQLAFAKNIGLDVRSDDRATASRRIAARLDLLNELALRALDLKPGDQVILRGKPRVSCVVSCVGRNRVVFLKGWGGRSVWPTQILKKKSMKSALN